MKHAWLLVAIAGCVDAADPVGSLAHEHIVAVRAQPPRIQPGESATLDALIAHRGAQPTDDAPVAVVVVSPHALFTAVHFNIDHWQIDCPPVSTITPLVVEMRFPAGEVATKTVFLGDTDANPAAPTFVVPQPVPLHEDIALGDAEWFTSCGTLDAARTTLRVDEPCNGELVAVVRTAGGGVAWQVVPLHAQ